MDCKVKSYKKLNKSRKTLKSEKGITLVAMVITVMVLITLAGIAISSGKKAIDNSKLSAFSTELQIMQTKVNELNQQYNEGDNTVLNIGYPLQGNSQENIAFTGAGIDDTNGYRYYAIDTIKGLGIDNVLQELLVNVQTRTVISLYGIKYEGEMHYTVEQVPDSFYNINRSTIQSKANFDLSFSRNGTDVNIDVKNITYEGNVKKGTIYYGQEQNGEIKWETAINNTAETSYKIPMKSYGTWNVKIVDTAGNESETKSITINKLSGTLTAANYGEYVNYDVEIGLDNIATEHKTDWRIFYNDGSNVFLIASDYVQNTKIPTLAELGMTTNGTYSVYWQYSTELPFKYAGMADVSEKVATKYQLGWRAANSTSENPSAKATAALLDTSKWSYFAGGIAGAEAVGGTTLEMYTKSWNAKGYTKLYCDNSDNIGYYAGTTSKPTTTNVNMKTDTAGYGNTLYYPHQASVDNGNCFGYWLASPSALNANRVMIVYCDGDAIGSNYYYTGLGVRPLVCLPSDVVGSKDANGIWQIH